MGYHIIYDASNLLQPKIRRRRANVPLMTAMFFIIFLFLVKAFWKEGDAVINKLLWAGDIDVLNKAIRYSLSAMENGHALSEALQTFCREMLYEAQLIG